MAPTNRLDVLAHRVRMLDRHRRVLSILIAVILCGVVSREVATYFGSQWGIFWVIVTAPFGAAAWWIVEAVFAWVIAMWETEHDRIARDRGLPRAELVRRRRTKT